jgi:hypothetical protein
MLKDACADLNGRLSTEQPRAEIRDAS